MLYFRVARALFARAISHSFSLLPLSRMQAGSGQRDMEILRDGRRYY